MIQKLITKAKRKLGLKIIYRSETSKVRHMVLEFCNGNGCDIGFGGDKIKKENCIGIDYAQPYANTGKDQVDISCDVMNESIPVENGTFDYVYSSHLIEDFLNTKDALNEFIRILKDGGNLILVFPDQKKYEEVCKKTGQALNMCHVHKTMGLSFMLEVLQQMDSIPFNILHSSNCEIDYNVILVLTIMTTQYN
jgi:ubiquinone/menaquinone biosynthesis C-methylase UbiE